MSRYVENRVLHLFAGDEIYGIGSVIKLYGKNLPESYFGCMLDGPQYEWLKKNGNNVVKIAGFGKFSAGTSLGTLLRFPMALIQARRTALRVREFCVKKDIQIIHTHWPAQQLVAGFLRRYGYKIVWHIHNNTSGTRLWGLGLKLNHILARWGADRIIAISRFISKNWEGAGVPMRVIYTGPETSNSKNAFRECNNSSPLKCVFFARLDPSKGLHIAVRAVLSALRDGANLEFDIFGGPLDNNPYVREIKADMLGSEAALRIRFVGFVPNIAERLKEYDVCLQCRIDPEPFGLSTCEALLAGLPVIGSATGATEELIDNGVNGFLYNALDSEELRDKLVDIDRNRNLVMKMKENAYVLAHDRFSTKQFVDDTINLYRSVLNVSEGN